TDNTSTTAIFWGDGSSTVNASQWLLIDPRYMRARLQTSETWSFSSGTNVTGALEFRGYGPLTFTSRGAGSFGNRTGTFSVVTVGGNSGVQVRSRCAVVRRHERAGGPVPGLCRGPRRPGGPSSRCAVGRG